MISLLCPTRRRPANMTRLVESAITTAANPGRVEIVWYIDGDDQDSIDTARALAADGVNSCAIIGKRLVLAECWNRCADMAVGQFLGHMGDDIVFRSDSWDAHVAAAFDRFPDRIALVHGRDGVHDGRLATHGFISREWVTALGRFVPPFFAHDYCDTWNTEVADRIGRRVFLPEVLTQHLHPDVGLAEYDETYRDHAEAGERDGVGQMYADLAGERQADADRLLEAIAC